MRLEVVRYDEKRRNAVLALQRNLWGRDDDLNRRILDWRYVENPLVERPHVYLLLVDGEVAGMRGFLPARWRLGVGSETTVLLSACDLVLDPKHQAKGLVRHLMAGALRDLAEQEQRFVLSFSASPATALLQRRQGWEQPVDYDWMEAESSRAGRLRHGRTGLKRLPMGDRIGRRLARWLEGPALGRLEPEETVRLTPAISSSGEPRLAAIAALMHSGPESPGRLRVAPTEAELAWRFRNPQRRYRFLYYEEAGRLLGFLALSARRGHAPGAVIVELRGVAPAIESDLLDALMGNGRVPRATTWSAGYSNSALEAMSRLGFSGFDASRGVTRFRPGFMVRSTAETPDPTSWQLAGRDVRDASSWELRPLASDAY